MLIEEAKNNLGFSRLRAHLLFERKTMPVPESGCLIWMGYTNSKRDYDYGLAWDERYKKKVLAHRFTWELFKGPIPNDMNVLHKCDVAGCVNPNHLFLGTLKDNSQDMIRKGRHKPGTTGGREWGDYCLHGHPRTEENTKYVRGKNGGIKRSCRVCNILQKRREHIHEELK